MKYRAVSNFDRFVSLVFLFFFFWFHSFPLRREMKRDGEASCTIMSSAIMKGLEEDKEIN